jgi:hypothetical protein
MQNELESWRRDNPVRRAGFLGGAPENPAAGRLRPGKTASGTRC